METISKKIKKGQNERGQSMVEFGLTAPIYALLLFGSIQMFFLPFQKAMSDKAVWEATRAAVTSTARDEASIEKKMAKAVDRYKVVGFFGSKMTVGLTEVNGEEQVSLTVPERLFFGLGVKLGDSGAMNVKGGSFENYQGPLPNGGGES